MPTPAFAPELRPGEGTSVCGGELPVADGMLISNRFVSEATYSDGKSWKFSSCQATTTGSAIARPVASVVVLETVQVEYESAEGTYEVPVSSYAVIGGTPLAALVVRRTMASMGVEKVLMQAW